MSDQEKLTSKRNSVESRYKTVDAEKVDLEQQLNQQVTRRRHFDDNIRYKFISFLFNNFIHYYFSQNNV